MVLYSFTKVSFWVKIIVVNNGMTSILSRIKKNHLFSRVACLLAGCFLYSMLYHIFLVPNCFVTGGISGLAIVIQEVFKMNATTFINISNVFLIILSLVLLGKAKTVEQLFGTLAYIVILNATKPFAEKLMFNFQSDMLMVIIVAILYGVANGLIYRPGFSTGGSDYISLILSEKLKKPITTFGLIINISVIACSAFVFSIPKVMFSIFIIYVSNKIINAFIFGVSTSKMVYVISKKNSEIENYIMKGINTGATEFKVSGGVLDKRNQMLLCVVHNAHYAVFKDKVLKMDPDAFILSNNCYEVNGGKKLHILPF